MLAARNLPLAPDVIPIPENGVLDLESVESRYHLACGPQ